MKTSNNYIIPIHFLFTGIAFLLLLVACNKTNNASLTSSTSTIIPEKVPQKVLLIVVDGAVGSEVKAAAPPTLMSLTNHSIYSWDGLTSYTYDTVSNQSGWANILTGVTSTKNQVTKDLATGNYGAYPTLFTRLKSANSNFRTVAFSSSNEVKSGLTANATISNSYNGDDAATKTAAISEIGSNNPDFVFVQFHAVDAAGSSSSYSVTESAAYKAAVLQTDGYIGELLNALKARSNYNNENWLIVITSNKGANVGLPNGGSWSAFDDKRHNVFTFYYNPRFVPKTANRPLGLLPYITAGYSYRSGNTTVTNRSATAILPYSTTAFNTDKEFTMQCKVKVPKSGNTSYGYIANALIGFRDPANSYRANGVTFVLTGNMPAVVLRTAAGDANLATIIGTTMVADGDWHTLTFVKRRNAENGTYSGIFYMDGISQGSVASITTSLGTANPFCVGMTSVSLLNPIANATYGTQGSDSWAATELNITDIRIYNTALTQAYISGNYCAVNVGDTDPYYQNLLGFWKASEVLKNSDNSKYYFNNYSPLNGTDSLFILDPSASDNTLSTNAVSAQVCPPVSITTYQSVPNSVDAMPVILSWFNFSIPASWNLDGKVWVPSYNDLIN